MIPHIAIPALFALSLIPFLTEAASAREGQCPASLLAGTWINPGAQTQDLIKVRLVEDCSAVEPGIIGWKIKAWAKCAPRNCVWGTVRAISKNPGEVVVRFDTFTARRYLKISSTGISVRVSFLIDYRSEARKDERGELDMIRDD